MKTPLHLSICVALACLFISQAQAQFYYFSTGTSQPRPCPWDSSQSITTNANWQVYQTQNDRWDGPIDSSRCISVDAQKRISLADIDSSKPVFIRYIMPSPNFHVLWPDQIYINQYYRPFLSGNSTFLLADSTCPNQQCTGLHMGIEIPDSSGLGTDMRWYSGNFARDPITHDIGFCFPSEKFSGQLIQELFFRIQFDRYDPASEFIFPDVEIREHFFYQQATSFTLQNTSASPALSLWDQFIMLHGDSTYPGPGNPFYIDVKLQPPSSQQKTLFLNIEQFAYLTGQPFTELRGDTVSGGNGLRHQVVVVNKGGTFCFVFIEVVMKKGNGYRHEGGTLAFQHASGCMAFHEGSFLEVADGETLRYGEGGLGVLLLKEGVEVRLGKQAELRIANRLVLDAVSADGNVHIYLPPGRKLSFTKSARIDVGGKSANPNAKLVVHLRGGELDESELAASSKAKIVILEEGYFANLFEDAAIRHEGKAAFLSFFLAENMPVDIGLYDLQGRLIWEQTAQLKQGQQLRAIPQENLHAGVYLIRLRSGQHLRGISYVKL